MKLIYFLGAEEKIPKDLSVRVFASFLLLSLYESRGEEKGLSPQSSLSFPLEEKYNMAPSPFFPFLFFGVKLAQFQFPARRSSKSKK